MNVTQVDAFILAVANFQPDKIINAIVPIIILIGKVIGIVVLAYLILTTIRGIWRSLNRKKCDIKRIPVQSPFPFLRKELPEIDHSDDPPDMRYASPQEYMAWQQKQANSEPEEPDYFKEEQEKEEPKLRPSFNAKVDRRAGIFRKKDLTKDDIRYLTEIIDWKYVEFKGIGIKGGRMVTYLVQPRSNETPIHFFYCKTIEQYLKTLTEEVRLYETKNPDIVFKIGRRKFAIEVETGRTVKNKEKMTGKVNTLNVDYRKRWFFVVTSYKLRDKYAAWGKTFLLSEVAKEIQRIFDEINNASNQPPKTLEQLETAKEA